MVFRAKSDNCSKAKLWGIAILSNLKHRNYPTDWRGGAECSGGMVGMDSRAGLLRHDKRSGGWIGLWVEPLFSLARLTWSVLTQLLKEL